MLRMLFMLTLTLFILSILHYIDESDGPNLVSIGLGRSASKNMTRVLNVKDLNRRLVTDACKSKLGYKIYSKTEDVEFTGNQTETKHLDLRFRKVLTSTMVSKILALRILSHIEDTTGYVFNEIDLAYDFRKLTRFIWGFLQQMTLIVILTMHLMLILGTSNVSIHSKDNTCQTNCRHFKHGKTRYNNVFQVNFIPGVRLICYPGSIQHYFNEKFNQNVPGKSLMNYEWARFESFKTFPETSRVSPMRLSQSGFHYTGQKEQVECFSCGLQNGIWGEDETVLETHRRLSPQCKFINGKDDTNVSIHDDTISREQDKTSTPHVNNGLSATGGPSDICRTDECQKLLKRIANPANKQINVPHNDVSVQEETRVTNGQSKSTEIKRATAIPLDADDKPRYHDYINRNVRLSTYTKWPCYYIPANLLADSGLFYTGAQDCVRCFQCGGGLRNWDQNDDPWVEHARWFPNCAYVKRSKGNAFITACQEGNQPSPETANSEVISGYGDAGTEELIENLQSPAVQHIVEMGYSLEQLEYTLQHLLQHNSQGVSKQTVIEYLLDNDFSTNETRQSSLVANQISQSCHSHDMVQSEHSRDCNASNDEQLSDSNIIDTTRQGNPADLKHTLLEENRQLKEQMMCKICMDRDASIVFIPCGHMVSCVRCASSLKKCAICRKRIQGTVRAFPC